MLIAVKNKFLVLFIIIFGTLLFPIVAVAMAGPLKWLVTVSF